MDFRKRDKTWINQLGFLFGEKSGSDTEASDIKDLKANIKNLLKKRTKVWWNKVSLETYLQKDIIPRGLRVQIYPTAECDSLFTNKWEDTLSRCSRTLLELLIGADKKKLECVEGEIDALRTKIQATLTVDECVETLPSFIRDTTDILNRLYGVQLEDDMLNDNHLNINLTWKYSKHTVEFLDVTLNKGERGFITTNVFRKSTATNTLLHATSSHHPQTFRSVPISQFLRIKHICSDDDTFEQQARILKNNLQQRGYNHRAIRAGYRRAKFTPREILLAQSRHNVSRTRFDNQPVRFITTFNSEWRVISDILRKYWPVLLADEDVEPYISQYPSITWRRSRNLKDLLTRSHYVAPHRPVFSGTAGPKWGSFQCGGCSACKFMERTFSFENSDSNKTFSITHHINCKTENVVYYAKCGCGLIYIGMTTRELRVRVLEHVRDIRNGALAVDIDTLKTVPKHFRLHHNSNPKWFKVRGIDRVQLGIRGGNYKKELLKRETRWMVDLDTVAPKGLNDILTDIVDHRCNIEFS
ncbi:unnamed protein product [Ranitomeya imitator]|uniref:Helix-turn-helix domain-containing protein n=1 Tax=Ranitomeya imitator TaxID=111125 RepID=A0ABN9LU81_9NEOB|nr:unnamed protein product [Ranitomeya imitator]